MRVAVVLASRRCPATGRKVPGRLARVGLGGRLQCTSEYPPASPTVCTWQVSSRSFFIGSVSHFSRTSFARMFGVSVEFSTGMFTTTHRHGVCSRSPAMHTPSVKRVGTRRCTASSCRGQPWPVGRALCDLSRDTVVMLGQRPLAPAGHDTRHPLGGLP